MNTHADKAQENKGRSVTNEFSQKHSSGESTFQFVDNRPETIAQRKLQKMANNSAQVKQLMAFQELAVNSPKTRQAAQFRKMICNNTSNKRTIQNKAVYPHTITRVLQRMVGTNYAQITTQPQLINALGQLDPQVRPMIQRQYSYRGATPQMLDAAISDSNLQLYNSMSRGELLRQLRPLLDNHVSNDQANFVYDTHGNRHFLGGSQGTKFTAGRGTVNPQLVILISAQIGRIRRDAKGNNQTYYFTRAGINECGNQDLTIQVDYTYATDTVTYHGYPDNNVTVYSLSRTKNGAAIP